MAASIQFRIIRNDFPTMPAKCRGAAKRGTLASAERIVQAARARAKVETGYMRDNTVAVGVGATDAEAQARAPYSGFLDKGTRYIAADYWFSGPATNEAQTFGPAMAGVLKAALG